MNQEIRSQIAAVIRTTGKYYGKDVDLEVLSMMVDDLMDLPADDVLKAYTDYRRDPKNKFFPLPAQIRGLIQPESNDEAKAKEIAGRIMEAVPKFGYPNAIEAQSFIGPVGWTVVQRFGGWSLICEQLGDNLNPNSFYAQVRDLIKTHLELGPQKLNDQSILEYNRKDAPGLNHSGEILKQLGIKPPENLG